MSSMKNRRAPQPQQTLLLRPTVVVAATTAALSLLLGACSGEDEPDPVPEPVIYEGVLWQTSSPYYTVGDTAVGYQSEYTREWFLTIGFDISNTNGTTINPRAIVSTPSGEAVTCEEDDLRRLPSLLKSTETWDLPCDGPLPPDPADAVIVVTDSYS